MNSTTSTTLPTSTEIVQRVRDAVAAENPELACTSDNPSYIRFAFPGYEDQYVLVSMQRRVESLGYRTRATGKYGLALATGYGREQFPPKKDGGHSYEKLAKRVSAIARQRRDAEDTRRLERARVEANPIKAAAVAEQLRLEQFGLVRLEDSVATGTVTVRVNTGTAYGVAPEKLAAFIEAARAIGLRV